MLSSGPFFPAFVLINETRLNPIALIVPSEQKSHEFDYGFFYFGSIVRVKNVWPMSPCKSRQPKPCTPADTGTTKSGSGVR